MELGKVNAYFDALVKFHKTTSQFKTKAEEISYVRGIVSKLQQALQTQEKLHRDVLLRKTNYAQSLVLTLQAVSDREVHLATASCILELLGQTKSGQRARLFVKLGGTQAVCQAIALEWRSAAPNESLLLQLHLVLSKLASKDKRLATKARLCQCAPVVLSLLRHGLATRGAERLLRLLRAYALSRQSSTSLGRHGAVQLLLRLLSENHHRSVAGGAGTGAAAARRQQQPGPARRAAEALSQLTRARANAGRAISGGAAATLMELLTATAVTASGAGGASAGAQPQQHRGPLLRAVVQTLRNITTGKAGRAAFNAAGGPASLYNLCLGSSASSAGELLSAGACIVLRQCAPRACLPVPSLLSPYTPALLQLLVSSTSASAVAVASDNLANADAAAASAVANSDEDEDDSSDDPDAQKQQLQVDDLPDDPAAAVGGPDPRSAEELRCAYGHLEPELYAGCCTCCPTVQLTPSPSLPSLAGLGVGQPGAAASADPVASRRLSVSATSALLAPALLPSATRCRSIAGYPEAPSKATPTPVPSTAPRSVAQFAITAGPELTGVSSPPRREGCDTRRSDCAIDMMLEDARRWIDPSDVLDRVVYDLDALVAEPCQQQQQSPPPPAEDEKLLPVGSSIDHLTFESRFESGNLRRAIQIREREYDLVLSPDVGHRGQTQWFYFRLANVLPGVAYRFNVINCEKPNSQFNCGMRPLLYSTREAQLGRPHWLRSGTRICYYRNHYQRAKQAGTKPYFTASFTLTFRHAGDICYLAYYVPYTYSRLMADLDDWRLAAGRDASVAYHQQWLCQSLGGNQLPLLTVTAASSADQELQERPCVFITGRVHPGEANASWVVRGLVAHLLSSAARSLRRRFVFKIVPMLNPDGVINGNHRCSLAVVDLNRTWLAPNVTANPEIYHAKGLMSFLCSSGRRPVVYIDCHGHSRHNNVFMFGCSPSLSWLPDDRDNPGWLSTELAAAAATDDVDGNRPVSGGAGGVVWLEDPGYRELPRLLAQMAPAFSWRNCNFKVDRTKESTARVVAWRHLGILRAYTLEASYSCCDQGPYRGCHVGTRELEEMGAKLGEAMLRWAQGEAPSEDPPPAQQTASAASSAATAASGRAGRRQKAGRLARGAVAAIVSVSEDDSDDTDDNEEEDGDEEDRGGDVDNNDDEDVAGQKQLDARPGGVGGGGGGGAGGSGDCVDDESILLYCHSSFVREPEGENCSTSAQ